MKVGLVAAAVIAGSVGFGGAAMATPAYVLLSDNASTLTNGSGETWAVNSCGGTNVSCSNLAMQLSGGGIIISGFSAGSPAAFPSLASVVTNPTLPADFTVYIEEFTSGVTPPNSITSASLFAVGGAANSIGGQVTIGSTNGGPNVGHYVNATLAASSIGNALSGYPSSITFSSAQNDVIYAMDVNISSDSQTVSLNVPEPASFGLLAVALGLTAFIRRRRII